MFIIILIICEIKTIIIIIIITIIIIIIIIIERREGADVLSLLRWNCQSFIEKKLLLKLDIDINMKKIGFVILLVLSLLKNIRGVEVKYQNCERRFKTLSRHIWRCSKNVTQSSHTIDGNHGNVEFRNQSLKNVDNKNSVAAPEGTLTDYDERMKRNRKTNYIECHCGKLCNGNRGLRAHQRFCHVNDIPELRDLFVQEIEQLIDNDTDNSDNESIINHIKIIPKNLS